MWGLCIKGQLDLPLQRDYVIFMAASVSGWFERWYHVVMSNRHLLANPLPRQANQEMSLCTKSDSLLAKRNCPRTNQTAALEF